MSVDEEAVERFRRRTRGTSVAVLRRNLAAGAYGPTGSEGRAIAQLVMDERSAVGSAAGDRPEDRAARAESLATRAGWVAVAALLLAALCLMLALARS